MDIGKKAVWPDFNVRQWTIKVSDDELYEKFQFNTFVIKEYAGEYYWLEVYREAQIPLDPKSEAVDKHLQFMRMCSNEAWLAENSFVMSERSVERLELLSDDELHDLKHQIARARKNELEPVVLSQAKMLGL